MFAKRKYGQKFTASSIRPKKTNYLRMKKNLSITITGMVQHVGFRFYAMQAAYKYLINGTIHNSEHDKVIIEAEGEEENLDQFVLWCKRGSPGSRVTDIIIKEGQLKNYSGFDVTRRD